ncbi:ankyrin repeat and LEM domain-containing protein 1 [Heterodontus francisci]|uniref:ankyrin repeat and LEM domain-containing protein 1 n=1 Tax=Heterodontus francisci TaxID=7792 RepID=UPI00355B75EC
MKLGSGGSWSLGRMSRELLARRLHLAIEEEDADSLEKWLKGTADPNLVLPEGIAALHLASGKDTEGGIRCLKLLLQNGANPNVRSTEDLTPLHVAASWGCVKSLKLLLRNGADPTLLDQDGLSAVQLAEEQGNVKCRQILQGYHHCSQLEDAEEDPPTYQYVRYRRVSSAFHFFADPVELGATESHKPCKFPGRSEEFHSSTLRQPELGVTNSSEISQRPSSYSTRNLRGGPLGEDTSVWSQSLRLQSQSGAMKPQGPNHHVGIAEDWSEDPVVGETTELTLDSCVLSSTHVPTFGKFEEQTSNGLNSAVDTFEVCTPADQELTLKDDESFLPVSATLLPPALNHGVNISIDDESFLPPSAARLCPVGNNGLNTSTNHLPEAQHFPVELVHAQRANSGLHEAKEVFRDGDASVGTEWLSELDCTCSLKGRSQFSRSLSNTMLDLAKHKGFCDSELLIRSSSNKGIDITSPDHVYLFERTNSTALHDLDKTTAVLALHDLDKTTAVLSEDTLDHTVGTDDDESPVYADTAQRKDGDSKALLSTSGSSSSPYCSCESESDVFSSAVESFKHTNHAEQVQEGPMQQTDKDPCLVQPTPSGRKQDKSVLGCKSEIATIGIQLLYTRDLQTLSFKDSQFIEKISSHTPLQRNGEQTEYNSPSPQRQQSYRDAGLFYSTLANPSDSDVQQSSRAGPTCTNSCMYEGWLTADPCNVMPLTKDHQVMLNGENESSPVMSPTRDTNNQNHKSKREDQPIGEPVSVMGHGEDGDFPGLLMVSTKQSSPSIVHANEPNLGISCRGSASINNVAGNKTQASLDEEYSSIEDEKDDEGGSGLEKLLKDIKIAAKTELSQQPNENSLSPFVTPRTKSRLANSSSRSYDPSLFEQTIAMPTRIRRSRKQQMDDVRSPSGWFDSHSNGSAISQEAENEDQTHSFAHCSDNEDADMDTVPFVRCNHHEKWTAQPLAASCPNLEDVDLDTEPFLNANHEKRTAQSSPQTHDANSKNQSARLKSITNASKGSQMVPFPHPISLEKFGNANQDGCICPPIRQSGTEVAQPDVKANGVDQRKYCSPSEEGDTPWPSKDNDLRSELYGAPMSPSAHSRPSSPCLSLVPLGGEPEAESRDCPRNSNVCESTRLEDTNSQLGNQRCSYSKRSVEERLSKIPNCNAEWQSLLGNIDLQLSPGGRPANSSVSETVEYLYTDTEDGHALIERRYPCKDTSFESLSTSVSEETVIYDWRAYKSGKTFAEEKENLLASVEQPRLSPSLLLSNDQIRRQLKDHGEDPGPVTDLTRKVYLHCLDRIRKEPLPRKPQQSTSYSPELCQTLDTFVFPDCSQDEIALVQQFDQADQNRKWREGLLKSSFNYLLLDPRVSKNLPARCHALSSAECFRTFVSSIFYVGKGKRSRPYCHLYEALTHFKNNNNQVGAKLKHILDIWESGQGVISLHCFQNVIPVEAYTREACMVDALGLQMLTNKKRGDYYGVAATWSLKRRRRLGIHMLRRALQIFLAEGERQLRPADIRTRQ